MPKSSWDDDPVDVSTRSRSFFDILFGRPSSSSLRPNVQRKDTAPTYNPPATNNTPIGKERTAEISFLFNNDIENKERRAISERVSAPASMQDFVEGALFCITDFLKIVDGFPRAFETDAFEKLTDLRRAVNEINRDFINRISNNRPGGGNSGGGGSNFGGGGSGGRSGGGGNSGRDSGGEFDSGDDWKKWLATALRAIAVSLRDWAIRIIDAMVGRRDVSDIKGVADLWRCVWEDFPLIALRALLLIIFGSDPGFFPA